MIEIPGKIRKELRPDLALVGDAALAADPLPGVGCGWAYQSAEWLAEAVGNLLQRPTHWIAASWFWPALSG
jgi:flavin-dependent dehydrogenase